MIPASGRVVGLDLGTARIGVALCDDCQRVAVSLPVLERSGDTGADRLALAQVVREHGAVGVVVGLPLSLDGSIGPAARAVLDEVPVLATTLGGVAVETVDERLTTVAAHQALRATGPSTSGPRRRAQVRRRVDSVAATLLLQSWLDRRGSV